MTAANDSPVPVDPSQATGEIEVVYQDALNAAFREFSQKQIQKANKPSIHKRLAAYRAMMPKKSKDKVKNRHQEQSR